MARFAGHFYFDAIIEIKYKILNITCINAIQKARCSCTNSVKQIATALMQCAECTLLLQQGAVPEQVAFMDAPSKG